MTGLVNKAVIARVGFCQSYGVAVPLFICSVPTLAVS